MVNEQPNERTVRTLEPTDRQRALKEWRAAHPGEERGMQARAIRDIQAQGIDISKAYVCEMWDSCAPVASPTPSDRGGTALDQLRALDIDLNQVRVKGDEKLGTDKTRRPEDL